MRGVTVLILLGTGLVSTGAAFADPADPAYTAETAAPADTDQGAAIAESDAQVLPFHLPLPEGWRAETIPFPLEFARDLPYEGLEELRFSPGMFERDSEQFWSYAFLWWVAPDSPAGDAALSTHLEAYFRGLAEAVAESGEFKVGNAVFRAAIETAEDGTFRGVAETLDPFVTREPVLLNVRGEIWPCPDQDRLVFYFALSPKSEDHPIWAELDSIRNGFACHAPTERP